MADAENRFEQIIKQTRIVFIQECIVRMAEIHVISEQLSKGEISMDPWIHAIYKHIHSMKGIALTLSYHQIDQSCQNMIDLIQKPRKLDWTSVEKNQLDQWIIGLNEHITFAEEGDLF